VIPCAKSTLQDSKKEKRLNADKKNVRFDDDVEERTDVHAGSKRNHADTVKGVKEHHSS